MSLGGELELLCRSQQGFRLCLPAGLGFVKAINQIIEARDKDRLQRIIDEGTPLQKIRAEQMMGIINEGALQTYVPELAQLVITEVTVHGAKKYTFSFMEGSKVTVGKNGG